MTLNPTLIEGGLPNDIACNGGSGEVRSHDAGTSFRPYVSTGSFFPLPSAFFSLSRLRYSSNLWVKYFEMDPTSTVRKSYRTKTKQESGLTMIDDDYDYDFLLLARVFPLFFSGTFSSSSDEISDSNPSVASGSSPGTTAAANVAA